MLSPPGTSDLHSMMLMLDSNCSPAPAGSKSCQEVQNEDLDGGGLGSERLPASAVFSFNDHNWARLR